MDTGLEFTRVFEILISRVQQIRPDGHNHLHGNSVRWHLLEFRRPDDHRGWRMHLRRDRRGVLQGDDLPNSPRTDRTIAPRDHRRLCSTLQVSQWVKLPTFVYPALRWETDTTEESGNYSEFHTLCNFIMSDIYLSNDMSILLWFAVCSICIYICIYILC